MDWIGILPEEVLCHILSFLTTKEAALTSVLSKKWRNVWTLVPNLDIDDSVFLHPEEGKRERDGILQSFMDFVDRVLTLQGDSPIKRFSLKCKTGIDTDRVNLWICNVLQRGVTSLELVLDFRTSELESDMYFLPEEMFVSNKLVELQLRSEFGVDWWPGGTATFLPMLKTLSFESEWILLCDKLEVFLSAFPVLEEFYLADIEWHETDEIASSASLRKLTIFANGFEDFSIPNTISFDTPNLVYLDYSDFVAADYPKVNLPNIVEAVLDLKLTGTQIELIREPNDEDDVFLSLGNVWKLMSGLKNVRRLFFSADTLEVLSQCCDSMPVFNNLKYLRIVSHTDRGWQAMPVLLRNCPRLETLVLEGLLHYVTDKCGDVCECISREDNGRSLSSCPVKKLRINRFQGTAREKEMIRHFLESFPCLDEMEVYGSNAPTNLEVPRIYKMVAYKVHAEEVSTETVLRSKQLFHNRLQFRGMSQTQMAEISSQFKPRNDKHMYDMVYILHGASPPPPQEMSQDNVQEQLNAAKAKILELNEDLKERQRVQDAAKAKIAKRYEHLDELFDVIVDQNPMIALALRARQRETGPEALNNQQKKRDYKLLFDIISDQNPEITSTLRDWRETNLERGETSRDHEMTELDQAKTNAVEAELLPPDED